MNTEAYLKLLGLLVPIIQATYYTSKVVIAKHHKILAYSGASWFR